MEKHYKKAIVVNATALDKSGALSILRQFVEAIPIDNRNWLVFTAPEVQVHTSNPNVHLEPIKGVKSMIKRLLWDTFGLKKWLKQNYIEPIASVSLQNTGFRVGKNVPTFIYYHQSIPFYQYKWNPFKKKERLFWFYKNIYPFLVKLFLKKDSMIFVQLEYIKEWFEKRFNHSKNLIGVYSPSVSLSNEILQNKKEAKQNLQLIYPATSHFYKNHRVIEDSLKLTSVDVTVLFTIDSENHVNHDERIKYIGTQPYERINELYKESDALLFPSFIETFGLPLLEAAMIGLPIIASDLPYAREVLAGYDGVSFVPHNSPSAWAKAIENIDKDKRYTPLDISSRPSWKELFENI